MNHMNLIVSIEEEFEIEIDEDKIMDLMSFKSMLNYVHDSLN